MALELRVNGRYQLMMRLANARESRSWLTPTMFTHSAPSVYTLFQFFFVFFSFLLFY